MNGAFNYVGGAMEVNIDTAHPTENKLVLTSLSSPCEDIHVELYAIVNTGTADPEPVSLFNGQMNNCYLEVTNTLLAPNTKLFGKAVHPTTGKVLQGPMLYMGGIMLLPINFEMPEMNNTIKFMFSQCD